MIDPDTVRSLQGRREWIIVQEHIEHTIASLDRNSDITGSDDRAIAVEVLARKRAVEKLQAILAPFVAHSEKPSIETIIQERKEDAGLI